MSKINKKIVLAPMAGITDLPFRVLCKELGADILYSEMTSAAGITYSEAKNLEYVNSCQDDTPLVVQLFGSKPKNFEKATKTIENLPKKENAQADEAKPFRPDGIDINFGCPVKKVLKQNSGCALMKDPTLAAQIIRAVTNNTSLPVSIKVRAGIEHVDALKFLEEVANLDWQTVMIHGRTFKQGFSGEIDFELIRKAKEMFPEKEVIANGGIYSPQDAMLVLEKTSADGIGIARGVLGNPWIFQQIKQLLSGKDPQRPDNGEIRRVMGKHLDLFVKMKRGKKIQEMRKHFGWYVRGFPNAKKLRKQIYEMDSSEQAKQIIEQI